MKSFLLLILCVCSVISVYSQETDIRKAKLLIENGQYLEAAKLLRPLAENGNPQAQYLAAGLFMEGKGVIKSMEQAEKYYLLAANSGLDVSIVKLCDIYDGSNRPEKAAQLLVELCEKYKELESSAIGFRLGRYYFTGHGDLDSNKLLGWGMMYRNKHNLGDNGILLLDKLKNEFYSHLIETKEPELLCQYFGYYYWKYMSKPEWTANYLDDVVKKIKKLPLDKQIEHFNVWEKNRLSSEYKDAAAVVLGMMCSEGVGCTQDIEKAKDYYSIISDETCELLYNNLYKYMDNGHDGHLNVNEFPYFIQVVNDDKKDRMEKSAFEARKANVKAHCTVPQINAQFKDAIWDNGTLNINFVITNNAVNSNKISITDTPNGIDANGKRIYGIAKLWGFTNTLAKNEEGYVIVIFENMPSSGKLNSISFSVQNQYGDGFINAGNVEWNTKYQNKELLKVQKIEKVHEIVEEKPEYTLGLEQHIKKYLRYPSKAKKDKIEGTVIVKFIIETDGSISNVEIDQKVNPYLDAEAKRIIRMMSKWKPGKKNGEVVATYVTVPIVFKL